MAELLKEEGYPDMQTFTRAYNKATELVKQYNRELDAWKRKVNGEGVEPRQQDRPIRESVRQQLRKLEDEAKGRNTQTRQRTRHHGADMER